MNKYDQYHLFALCTAWFLWLLSDGALLREVLLLQHVLWEKDHVRGNLKGFRPPMEGETKPEVLTNAGQYHDHSMERRDHPENAIFYGR